MIYLILLSLVIGEPEEYTSNSKLYIVYDDSDKSKMLKSELTRNWLIRGESDSAIEMNKIQKKVSEKIVLIDRYGDDLRYRNLKCGYPCYIYSEYGKAEPFPELTFNEVSYPLRSTNAIISQIYTDLSAWKRKCEQIKYRHDSNYELECIAWCMKANPKEYEKITTVYYAAPEFAGLGEEYYTLPFDVILKNFEKYEGFPKKKPVVLPEKPILKFPWEE